MSKQNTFETVSKSALVGAVTAGVAVCAFATVALPLHWLGVPDGYTVAAGCVALRLAEKHIKGLGILGIILAGASMDHKNNDHDNKLGEKVTFGLGLGAAATFAGAFFLGSAVTKNTSDIDSSMKNVSTTETYPSTELPERNRLVIS